jgi:hypothetical protein
LSALQPNQAWLDGQAESLHDEMHYPGVTATNRTGQATRRL